MEATRTMSGNGALSPEEVNEKAKLLMSGITTTSATNTTDDEDPYDSWAEIPLERRRSRTELPKATLGARDDGACLIPRGQVTWIPGEPEAGKSWFALFVAAEQIRLQEHVVWFDFEIGQAEVQEMRLIHLGISEDELDTYFHPVEPEVTYDPKKADQYLDTLVALKPSLVVFDAADGVIELQGGNPNGSADIKKLGRLLFRPFTSVDAAVVVVDHVVKNTDNRKGWAAGSNQKKGIASAQFTVDSLIQFATDGLGASKLTVNKDRHSCLPARRNEVAAYLISRDGQFALVRTLPVDIAQVVALLSGMDDEAIIETEVKECPGEYTIGSLAIKLAKTGKTSVSTWQRKIKEMVDAESLEQQSAAGKRGKRLFVAESD